MESSDSGTIFRLTNMTKHSGVDKDMKKQKLIKALENERKTT